MPRRRAEWLGRSQAYLVSRSCRITCIGPASPRPVSRRLRERIFRRARRLSPPTRRGRGTGRPTAAATPPRATPRSTRSIAATLRLSSVLRRPVHGADARPLLDPMASDWGSAAVDTDRGILNASYSNSHAPVDHGGRPSLHGDAGRRLRDRLCAARGLSGSRSRRCSSAVATSRVDAPRPPCARRAVRGRGLVAGAASATPDHRRERQIWLSMSNFGPGSGTTRRAQTTTAKNRHVRRSGPRQIPHLDRRRPYRDPPSATDYRALFISVTTPRDIIQGTGLEQEFDLVSPAENDGAQRRIPSRQY